jgi:hypothetical protein
MRLDDLDPSSNARDLGSGRSGFGGGGGGGIGGLIGLLPMLLGRKMGIGTIIIIAIVGYFMFSGGGLGLSGGAPASNGPAEVYDTKAEQFSGRVLTSTEQTWSAIFREQGQTYRPTGLSFYQGGAQSGCGAAQSAMGPFYCPTDNNIYLDTAFYDEMASKMGAGGDFAQAYVIAHEVGHHIQNLTGTLDQARGLQARASQTEGNAIQVKVELQADCYAGVWAGRNRDRIEPGDVEEGLTAAHQIGDDTLMESAGRNPVESMFTHGSSEQRMAALKRGLDSGDPKACAVNL